MIRPSCNKIHKSYSVRHVVARKVGSPYNDQVPIIQMDINIKKYFAIDCKGLLFCNKGIYIHIQTYKYCLINCKLLKRQREKWSSLTV